jgi:hypothetical protein
VRHGTLSLHAAQETQTGLDAAAEQVACSLGPPEFHCTSVTDLARKLRRFITKYNEHAKPVRWSAPIRRVVAHNARNDWFSPRVSQGSTKIALSVGPFTEAAVDVVEKRRVFIRMVEVLKVLWSVSGRDVRTSNGVTLMNPGDRGIDAEAKPAGGIFERVDSPAGDRDSRAVDPEAHAASRWVKAVVPVVDSPRDIRTIEKWGLWIAASPGTVRNWCFTAGIAPRRSLVFARILRAVVLSQHGRRKPESLLDVVDRRTCRGLLRLAGLSEETGGVPQDVEKFLRLQTLVRDADVLSEIRKALQERWS